MKRNGNGQTPPGLAGLKWQWLPWRRLSNILGGHDIQPHERPRNVHLPGLRWHLCDTKHVQKLGLPRNCPQQHGTPRASCLEPQAVQSRCKLHARSQALPTNGSMPCLCVLSMCLVTLPPRTLREGVVAVLLLLLCVTHPCFPSPATLRASRRRSAWRAWSQTCS